MYMQTQETTATQRVFDVEQAYTPGADPRLVWEAIVDHAVKCRVSDIHVLARKDLHEIAFRVDGDMQIQGLLPHTFCRRMINHVKSIAGMDISEHRRPTEGRLKTDANGGVTDLRISAVSGIHGMDMVVRVLDHRVSLLDIDQLQMLQEQRGHIADMLARPSGLILISGPTGSGKTTTLYAMLQHLAGNGRRKIVTIEDPVEYEIEGIHQMQVNTRIGVNFASLLTAILRQDPDVIMVGEIRDPETAMIATRAANMGNLVLATTHATFASRAVEAMLSLGVHPFFLAASLQGVVTQVLVKRICPNCRREMPETSEMVLDTAVLKRIEPGCTPQLSQGVGCENCFNTGYRGRMALFELFRPNETTRNMILERRPAKEIDEAIAQAGWLGLSQAGKLAAVTGLTTMEEIVRAVPTL